MPISTPNDRRATRTRRALLNAFVGLILERRYDEISVAAIIARADVGRSTFYEHFRGKDDLLHESMNWLLVMIADAAGPAPNPDQLAFAVAHFWQNRRLARVVFSPPIAATERRFAIDGAAMAEVSTRTAEMNASSSPSVPSRSRRFIDFEYRLNERTE